MNRKISAVERYVLDLIQDVMRHHGPGRSEYRPELDGVLAPAGLAMMQDFQRTVCKSIGFHPEDHITDADWNEKLIAYARSKMPPDLTKDPVPDTDSVEAAGAFGYRFVIGMERELESDHPYRYATLAVQNEFLELCKQRHRISGSTAYAMVQNDNKLTTDQILGNFIAMNLGFGYKQQITVAEFNKELQKALQGYLPTFKIEEIELSETNKEKE